MLQHYIQEIGQPDHLRLASNSDVFTHTGRTQMHVIWDLSVKRIGDNTCEFTNAVRSSATPELVDFLAKQESRGRFSRLLVSRFRKLITGGKRPCSQKVSSVTPHGTSDSAG
jgi:hypothetical protein